MNELNIAFKEWAVVANALLVGKQSILFRKGGIIEKKKTFSVDHQNFLLFPTYFHEKKEDLVSDEWAQLAESKSQKPKEGTLELPGYMQVSDVHYLESLDKLKQFQPFGIWSLDCLKERFNWGEHKGIHLILGRVFKLPEPVSIPMEKSYEGCKSWVELSTGVSLEGGSPVITDEAYEFLREKLNSLYSEDAPIDY